MTDNSQPQTFHPEIENAFDEGAKAPLMMQQPKGETIIMSAELFDQMIAKGEFNPDKVKHTRVTRPEGKADVVIMPTDSYADLLDRTQVVMPIEANAAK